MGSNIRIMKAVSLELYKRLMESQPSYSNNPSFNLYGTSSATENPSREPETAELFPGLPAKYMKGDGTIDENPLTSSLLNAIPDRQKGRAKKLIDLILQKDTLKISPSGEIVLKGQLIKNSNIVDLISTATKSSILRKIKLPGYQKFLTFLKEINTPKSFLGSHFAKMVENVHGDDSPDKTNCREWITFEYWNR